MRVAEAEARAEADVGERRFGCGRRASAMPWIASGSARMRSTVWRGCSEPYGSWNTICTRRQKALVAAARRAARRPCAIRRRRPGARPQIARSIVDLPEPDSPTRPKVSPRADREGDAVDGADAGRRPTAGRSTRRSSISIRSCALQAGVAVEHRQRVRGRRRSRQAVEQAARVGVACARAGRRARELLDDPARVHHEHAVAEASRRASGRG